MRISYIRSEVRSLAGQLILFLMLVFVLTGCGRDADTDAGAGEETGSEIAGKVPEFSEFSQLEGKTMSMLTGAPFEELILTKVSYVKEFTYFASMPDMTLAVSSGKTDACLSNNALSELAVNREEGLALFPEPLKEAAFGIAFAKGNPDLPKWQEAYDSISEETKDALWEKWTGADESIKVMPPQTWDGSNGTVKVAACDTVEPMSYAGEGGAICGFDAEMILLMAKEMDVKVEFTGMEFAAVLSAVQSGKADMACGSIIITDERRQAVDFVEYYPAAFVLIVRAANAQGSSDGFLSGVKESFEKTFIRESRWKLFVSGIETTLIITVLSVLFGTILGFAVFMACRNGNAAANLITKFAVWLVQGMPMMVLLMILYYIIFDKVEISGVAVAIVGFTLVFGAGVYGMLKVGVGAVDKGQMEGALALGYSQGKAFFNIILPQAIPHVLPVYQGELVALLKSTAIVGYIAVQDLTRMGDLIRARTYDAFFPLIAVAVIYFILAALLTAILKRVTRKFDYRQRSIENIMKGIRMHD